MEEKSTSTFKFALSYGLYTGIASIVVSLIFYVLDISIQSPIQYSAYLIFIAGMVWGANNYKNEHGNGFLSYGKAFGISFVIGVIATVLSTIFGYILIEYIDPSIMTQIIEEAEQTFIDQGMTDAQIDQMMELSAKMGSPIARTIIGLVSGAIFMAIISLITSIFVKKEEEF